MDEVLPPLSRVVVPLRRPGARPQQTLPSVAVRRSIACRFQRVRIRPMVIGEQELVHFAQIDAGEMFEEVSSTGRGHGELPGLSPTDCEKLGN